MRIIRFTVWKSIVSSSRLCYRSVCNHPLMAAMMTLLVYMYRLSPSLFFILVSVSPVIVSTGILLGILLIYGQANVPQPHVAKEEEKISYKVEPEPTKTVFMRGDDAVGRRANSEVDIESEMEMEIKSNKRPIEEVKRRIDEDEVDDRKVVENHYSLIQEMIDEDDDETGKDRSPVESIDTRLADMADSSASQAEESDDEEVSDTVSDKSFIPDPSMAVIMPMLDELHPLLEEDAPQTVHITSDDDDDDDSDAVSEPSQDNNDSAKESDDEEESENEGESKSAITWTEDDHKNVLNLGSSEVERNQRLEHLIARRRKTISERNLIDFESSSNVPSNLTHISTKRQNPFDLPFDNSYGLPPIPGSAPSVMLPRQNPFDIQFDHPRPQQQQQQPFMPSSSSSYTPYRRHESFNMGSSTFASRQEKYDAIFRPYFFQYQLGMDGTRGYSSIPRSSSSEPSSSNSSSSMEDDQEDLSEQPNIPSNSDSELNPLQTVGHDIESSSSSSSEDNFRNHPEIQHKENPVYDTSPNSTQRSIFSMSSNSGNLSLETNDIMIQPSNEQQKISKIIDTEQDFQS